MLEPPGMTLGEAAGSRALGVLYGNSIERDFL
jgi:hypothetical protein